MPQVRRIIGLVLATVFAIACVPVARAAYPPDIGGVEYANVNGQPLLLDIFFPFVMTGPTPVVIYIHGGGWRANDRTEAQFFEAREMNFRGFIVVSIDYRYSTTAIWPAQLHDCKAAVRWVRANAATYNMDPTRIGVSGFSSGGQLAAMIGATGDEPELEGVVGSHFDQSSKVQAVVTGGAHTNFLTITGQSLNGGSSASGLLGINLGVLQANLGNPAYMPFIEQAQSASVVNYLDALDPPIFAYHGEADPLVPASQGYEYFQTAQSVGIPVTFVTDPLAGHWIPYANSLQQWAFLVNQLMHGGAQAPRFAMSRMTVDGGGGASTGGLWRLVGDVAQPDAGAMSGGNYTLAGGFFHNHPAAPTPCPGDVNNDRMINAADLAFMLGSWGNNPLPSADINGDTLVNSADLAALLGGWGPCPP